MRHPMLARSIAVLMLVCFLGIDDRNARSQTETSFRFETIAHVGGPSRAVAIAGERVLLGEGERVLVVDIQVPTRPRVMGRSAELGDTIEDIELLDDRAYVAAEDGGLVILDLSQASDPREIGRYDPGRVSQVEIEGTRGYLSANARLQVVDLRSASDIRLLGSYEERYAEWIAVDDGIVWASDRNGVTGIDARRPEAMRAIARQETRGSLTAIAASDGYVYLPDSTEGLVVLDARDPANTVRAGVLATDLGLPSDIIVSGDRVFVAGKDLEQRVEPFDLYWAGYMAIFTRANRPRLIARADTGAPAEAIAADEGRIAVASAALRSETVRQPDYFCGLNLYQGSTRIARLPTLGMVAGIDVDDRRALVGAGTSGAWLWDVEDPWTPTLLDRNEEPQFASEVELEGSLGLVVDGTRAIAYPMDANGTLAHAGTYPAEGQIGSISLQSRTGLVSAAGRIDVVELSDPEEPRRLASLEGLSGSIWHENASSALVAGGPEALTRLDLSDPAAPTIAGGWSPDPPRGVARAVAAHGDLAFLGMQVPGYQLITPLPPRPSVTPGGPTVTPTPVDARPEAEAMTTAPPDAGRLHVVDLAAAPGPDASSRLEIGGPVSAVEVDSDGQRVFTAGSTASGWGSSLLAIDVSDPRAPLALGTSIDRLDFEGIRAAEMTFRDGLLYVAAFEEGLWILRPVAPGDATPTPTSPRPTRSPSPSPSPDLREVRPLSLPLLFVSDP